MAFATACGKDAVEVKDRAGFIVNALLFPYLNNAVRMLEHGTAIDGRHRHRHEGRLQLPDGPARAARPRRPRHVARRSSTPSTTSSATRTTPPSPTLRRMVAAGQLGRKTGAGLLRVLTVPRVAPRDCWTVQQPDARVPIEPPPTPLARCPSPDAADDDGIVGVGADLEPGTLLAAYRRGLFPMPVGRRSIAWFSPDPRAIIPLDGLRVSRSLRRSVRRYEVRRRHRVRRGDGALRRPAPARRLDHAERSSTPTRACTSSAGPTASSATTTTASSSAASTACASAASSPASRCSTPPPTRRRSPSSRLVDWLGATGATLLDVQWTTPHLASLGAVDDPPPRVPRAARRGGRRWSTAPAGEHTADDDARRAVER